ncbi:aladin [Dendroctonus ponderosae]|uniref:aladin n=1 Tax=Dendroctonus ponderosae TaxID=77166 RepID=UPI00203595E5|nr:aladin [Dendroctonus ponderosae]XP_048520704.1 aladin [Dendroctonus ponderosae]
MRNLQDFDAPSNGEISVCELNGKAHSTAIGFANLSSFTSCIESHPQVHITRDQLYSTTSSDEGKALFLPVDVSFLKQLTQVYYEQGTIEALYLAKSHKQVLVSHIANGLLTAIRYIEKVRLIMNPNVRYSGPALICKLGTTRDWQNSTIRSIAWHPYGRKLAVVTCDDSVRIFCSESSYSPLLRCKQQRNITCAAWRPMSATEIAVGHENGIIVWSIDANSLVSRPSVSNAIILHRLEHKPVMSIAWSPKGDMLISAAACDSAILVWNPELDRTSSLKRPGGCGHVLVKWSPTGDKIFTCSDGLVFRVWDHRTWECDRWTVASGRVQSACWANCGHTVLFATSTDPVIYGLIVKRDVIFASDVESSSIEAIPLFDVSKTDLFDLTVGGLVQSMEADPAGSHLAVVFQDTSAVTVFTIARQSALQLIPSSIVTGLAEEKPTAITFQQDLKSGACLTVGWSSGRIQYYPIIYSDLAKQPAKISMFGSIIN